ncbi:MAG: hypothetical protein NC908_05655, partial [Candidatus Omnitrophica bacterium]|nr:hypothetical protein [Candidatus Omnitrophota bacterium]
RQLQEDINTTSSSQVFNLYAKQTYLDNIIRGGYPVIFQNNNGTRSVFYIYTRKHGDLERDYNRFQIQPSYLSQGNGNYRDVNQNRRCNIWFIPEINDYDVITFLNLIQSDGFNPLVLEGTGFIADNINNLTDILRDIVEPNDMQSLKSFLANPFTPGELIFFIEENRIKLKVNYDEFLEALIPHCHPIQKAHHSDGYWIDHWHYNLDLLENYLGIYPEKLEELIFDKKTFVFFDNATMVKPRSKKYVLTDKGVRQYKSVFLDETKLKMLEERTEQPYWARIQYGKGQIYQTCLINKLLCLVVNKLASLDPFGIGIEMEADKPNWFDALNGLPALLGSSLCETQELKRLVVFIQDAIQKTKRTKIYVTEEIYSFLVELAQLTERYLQDDAPDKDFKYWDQTHTLKENYRDKTKFGFSGKELEMSTQQLNTILENMLKKIEEGIAKAFDKKR